MPDSPTCRSPVSNEPSLVVRVPSSVANAAAMEDKHASDNSQPVAESQGEPEFKEGGYGW